MHSVPRVRQVQLFFGRARNRFAATAPLVRDGARSADFREQNNRFALFNLLVAGLPEDRGRSGADENGYLLTPSCV